MTEKEVLIEIYSYSKEAYFKNVRRSDRIANIKDKIDEFISLEKPEFDVGEDSEN